MNRNKIAILSLIIVLNKNAEARIQIPPQSKDEFEVIESVITDNITTEDWKKSEANEHSLNFEEFYLENDGTIKEKVSLDSVKTHRGIVQLKNRQGVIYNIVDPVAVESKLNIKSKGLAYVRRNGEIAEPVEFYTYSNYKNKIKNYELRIFDYRDVGMLNPYALIKGDGSVLSDETPIVWNGQINQNRIFDPNEKLAYVLRVYDESGNFDETEKRVISLKSIGLKSPSGGEKVESIKEDIYGVSNLNIKNIVVSGANVRFYGRDIPRDTKVFLDRKEMEITPAGDFIYEKISDVSIEKNELDITYTDGNTESYILETKIPKNYEFYMGIADFVYGKNTISGNSSILEGDTELRAGYYNQGRLAGYYKRIQGKYKITAQVDTWDQEIKDLFNDFYERDSDVLFRKIEKDYLYYNYGDESEIYSDVDTQGKMYLRVDWDKSQALWGNYDTDLHRGEYYEYSRTLYGARGEYNSLKTNEFGDSKYQLTVFGSKPYSSYTRDEFLGTGGSIYYLSERDIVLGSAKLSVEIRNKITNRLISRIELTEGVDYTINELTGRVILNDPLTQESFIQASNDIIKDSPSSSFNSYLIADYEFYTTNNNSSDKLYGGSGKTWITDNVGLGGMYVKEDRTEEGAEYEIRSVNLTLKKSEGTYLYGELTETDGTSIGRDSNWYSFDGGYSFERVEPTDLSEISGGNRAYYIEGSLQPANYIDTLNLDDRVRTWYSKKERGFSIAADPSGSDREEFGINIEHTVNEKLILYSENSYYKEEGYDEIEKTSEKKEEIISVGGEYEYSDRLNLTLETEYRKGEDSSNDGELADDIGESVLVGAKVALDINDQLEVYTKVQGSVWRTETYKPNNMVTLGSRVDVTDKLSLGAGYSTGNRGDAAEATASYLFNPDYEIYAGYHFENDSDLDTNTTIGQRFGYTEKINLYQENSYIDNDSKQGLLQLYGIDYEYDERFTFDLVYQQGDINIEEGDLTRRTIATGLRYEDRKVHSRHKLEWGKDSGARNTDTYATINNVKWKPTPEYTFFAEANYIYIEGDLGYIKEDEFVAGQIDLDNEYYELGLGIAYRPTYNDRLNIVSAWNYIHNVDTRQGAIGLSEKSNIFSIEGIYDFTQEFSIASKYAVRMDEVRLNSGGDWYESNIDLFAVRGEYEVIYSWDMYVQYHILNADLDNEKLSGFVVGVFKDITEHFKIGAGYNFTEFSDDLTNLDYTDDGQDLDFKSKGWFINFIGKI